jgi:hypothetical protein
VIFVEKRFVGERKLARTTGGFHRYSFLSRE